MAVVHAQSTLTIPRQQHNAKFVVHSKMHLVQFAVAGHFLPRLHIDSGGWGGALRGAVIVVVLQEGNLRGVPSCG